MLTVNFCHVWKNYLVVFITVHNFVGINVASFDNMLVLIFSDFASKCLFTALGTSDPLNG